VPVALLEQLELQRGEKAFRHGVDAPIVKTPVRRPF
jgi:hypothetical protein